MSRPTPRQSTAEVPIQFSPVGSSAAGAIDSGRIPAGRSASDSTRYSPATLAQLLGLPTPTAQQSHIIAAPLAPLLVIAGAGSGKTETMAARVVWLVANGMVRAEEILGLTFTRKAAGELSARIRARLAGLRRVGIGAASELGEGEPAVATYHSYAARIVAEHGLRAGMEPTTRLLGPAASWQLVDSTVASYDGDMSEVEGVPATVVEQLIGLAGEFAEHVQTPHELQRFTQALCDRIAALPFGNRRGAVPPEVRKMLARQRARLQLLPLLEEYERRKQAVGAMDFADQLVAAARLARDHREVAAVERRRFRVVLLDEYQDTSHAQLVLLRAIFGRGFPVIAVGDPSQAIYGWRGASANNLTRFPHDFLRWDGQPAAVAPLAVSWRNAGRILGLANEISRELRQAAPVPVPELAARAGAENAGTVLVSRHRTISDEADYVADTVAAMWRGAPLNGADQLSSIAAGQPSVAAGAGRPVGTVSAGQPPSTAILVRKRDHIDAIATRLRARGVPVEIVGLGGLLATPEVRDVVAALTIAADPGAGAALLRLLTGPRWRLGPRDLNALGKRARDLAAATRLSPAPDQVSAAVVPAEADLPALSLAEALDDLGDRRAYSPLGYRRLCAVRDVLRRLRARFADSLGDQVNEAERLLGVDIEVMVRGGRANLDAFAQVVAEFSDATPAPTLSGLLAYLRAAERREYGLSAGEVQVHDHAVQILTVHAAKGLEWDVVAVVGLVGGVFPSGKHDRPLWTIKPGVLPFPLRGDADDLPALDLANAQDQVSVVAALEKFTDAYSDYALNEERRLAYVAFTRARHTLLCSGYWFDESATKARPPSAFLDEAYAYAATGAGVVTTWVEQPDADEPSPLTTQTATAQWPLNSGGEIELRAAAELVRTADQLLAPASEPAAEAAAAWAAEAKLLLAERSALAGPSVVTVPEQLPVSALVTLRRNPQELARAIRRPMPRPPAPDATRGTAFHSWLERRFGAERLFDLDELPGAGDAHLTEDPQFVALREAFLASSWADRQPLEVEVPFATVIAGVVVRGRIDAVFAVGDSFEVIDWKTGAHPTGTAATVAAVQLAAYRLAWAELAGVPVEKVSAAFHYVAKNHTERPVDLLDAAGLTDLVAQIPLANT